MTLPASGQLTISQILAEIGDTYPVTIPNANWRTLAGKPSGSLVIPNDFWGKTWGGGGGGGGGSNVAMGGSSSANTVGSVASIAALSYGTIPAAAGRRIFAIIEWACTADAVVTTLNSATIGGIAATIHVQNNSNGTSAFTNYGCAIISATVPTGTSGTLAATFSNATLRTMYASYCGVQGLVSSVAFDTASAFAELLSDGSVSAQTVCNIGAKGLLFLSGIISSNSAPTNLIFTGANEQIDADGGANLAHYGNAMSFSLGAQSSRPVGVSGVIGVAGRARLAAASFQLT